ARLKTYGALFGDKNHKAFSRFCLCGHEKSGLAMGRSVPLPLPQHCKLLRRRSAMHPPTMKWLRMS
ncbi:hypothetical protein, partial [Pseudomonas aeruginosa]|uniref:hypothetical protein n=1 Tax=Pseudomonas aeruginosa TaxID=287 RepID=UPI001E2FEAA8